MPGWNSRLLVAALLAGMTLVAYWPTYSADFIDLDDVEYIRENAHVATGLSGENARWAMTHAYAANWHPLTWISHMLDVELFALDARGHHVVNVVLHAANAGLLFLLFTYMTGNAAASFLLAALFALHPINVESVAWVSQRKTTLSTLFGILAVWGYAVYARRRDRRAYAGSLVLFACSLMAKQTFVTLPFALVLLDYWPLARQEFETPRGAKPWRARSVVPLLLEKLPYLLLAVLACVATMAAQQQAMMTADRFPLDKRLGNIAIAYVMYLYHLLWPLNLSVFYPLYQDDVTLPRVAGAVGVLTAITAACCYWGRAKRYLPVGWFWYLGSMVPLVGLVQVGGQSMADRYAYVSFWGLWIIIAWAVRDLILLVAKNGAARKLAIGGSIGLVAVCAWFSAVRAAQWRDTVTLFEDALHKTKHNWLAHRVLAERYLQQGDFQGCLDQCQAGIASGRNLLWFLGTQTRALEGGVDQFRRAAETDPGNAQARANLGWAYCELGQYKLAEPTLATAAGLLTDATPRHLRWMVYDNWSKALAHTNRLVEAKKTCALALAIDPRSISSLRNAGEIELQLNDFPAAAEHLRRAVELDPADTQAASLLAQAELAAGNLPAAEQGFERVLQLVPHQPDAALKLAEVLIRQGRADDAVARLTAAASGWEHSDNPNAPLARSILLRGLGDIASTRGMRQAAIEQYESALSAWEGNFEANNNLAWILATTERGDGKRALTLARRACELRNPPSSVILGTLAAAQAASGQAAEAVQTAEQAQELARAAGDSAAVAALELQLKSYRGGQPYLAQ